MKSDTRGDDPATPTDAQRTRAIEAAASIGVSPSFSMPEIDTDSMVFVGRKAAKNMEQLGRSFAQLAEAMPVPREFGWINRRPDRVTDWLAQLDEEQAATRRLYLRTALAMFSLMILTTPIILVSGSPWLNAGLIVGTLVGSMMVALDVGVPDGE